MRGELHVQEHPDGTVGRTYVSRRAASAHLKKPHALIFSQGGLPAALEVVDLPIDSFTPPAIGSRCKREVRIGFLGPNGLGRIGGPSRERKSP